jgi:hypothetical protein
MFREYLLLRRWDWKRVEAVRASRLSLIEPRNASAVTLERM